MRVVIVLSVPDTVVEEADLRNRALDAIDRFIMNGCKTTDVPKGRVSVCQDWASNQETYCQGHVKLEF